MGYGKRSEEGLGSCVDIVAVAVLRELMRNLIPFRNLYEDTGQDILVGPDRVEYSLWDLERLYESLHLLPPRQAEAIELCLVRQYKEREAALAMGVSETNPVAMYATDGLKNLIKMVEAGTISWARPSVAA